MPGFQVGDILANLGIDISGLKQAFDEAKKSAKTFSSEVKGAISGIATGAQQALGVDKITAAFARATQAAKDFEKAREASVARVGVTTALPAVVSPRVQGILNAQENERLAVSIGTTLRGAFDSVVSVLGTIGRVGLKAFSLIGSAVSSVIGSVSGLIHSLVSIPTLLAGFGVFKLAERAAEVDDLTTAFDNLSKSIGAISQTFLPKLRTATRGTVSDLELMRTTNNAIVLGVAKDADAFAELAENARRLGQAVGRGPVDALNDLVTGIGRQSFRVLDNIGIIVRAGEAYDAYATSIGKTTAQLTDSERRFAFQLAVQEQIRKKVAELGPEVLTVGTAFRQLGATISNTFSDIAQGFVTVGALSTLRNILEDLRPRIAAFVKLVRDSIGEAIDAIRVGFGRLQSGDLKIADILDATFGGLIRAVKSLVANLAPVFFEAGADIGRALIRGFASEATNFGRTVFSFFQKIGRIAFAPESLPRERVLAVADAQVDEINTALNKLKGAIDEDQLAPLRRQAIELSNLVVALQAESDKIKQADKDAVAAGVPLPDDNKIKERVDAILATLISFRGQLDSILASPQAAEDAKRLADSFGLAFKRIREEFSTQGGQVLENFIGKLTGDEKRAKEIVDRIGADFAVSLKDPLAGFRPIQTDRFVQPLANIVNKLAELRAQFFRTFAAPEAAIKQTAVAIQILTGVVELAAKGGRKVQQFFTGPSIDAETFSNFTKEAEENISKLNFERLTAGFSDTEKAVAAFDERVKEMGPASDKQVKALDRLRVALIGVAAGAEAAKGAAALEANVRDFGKSQGQIIAENAQAAINAIKLSPTFDPNDPETKKNLDELNTAVQRAVSAQENIQFRDLTKDLSTSVFGGIVDGFERGESAAKIWSGIVSDIFRKSMTRVIDSLTNVISKAFGDLFGSLGLGLGGADFATGLIGVGSAILVGLRNRRDQTVSDFAQSVNSSEAVRGVVAGPTNVAIARVGDSLKIAMQTTEQLLLRIATDIENGRGGGTATGGFFSVRTTPSTTT